MRRAVAPLLAVTVALVLADSAVVTLALPDILRNLHTSVAQVAWVLISFNLVLGLVAVPMALLFTRARPRIFCAVGIAVFASASAWCASAPSIEVLLAARCLQALGGAAALIGCLELLVAEYGERRGVAAWVTAGVVGTASGPVVGGLLTQAFSWQAIFVVQVPMAVLAVPAALAVPAVPTPAPGPTSSGAASQPDPCPAVGRTHGGVVPARPAPGRGLAPLAGDGGAGRVRRAGRGAGGAPTRSSPAPPDEVEVAVGCFLIAGGLVGLAILPSADLAWTIAPQALVGLGLGLTIDRLTSQAMQMRLPRVEHAGWTISARHIGVVVGLAILTPVFTADLQDAQVPAQEAITSLVLDAPLQPQDKIAVARALGHQLSEQQGQVPDLHPAFATLDLEPGRASRRSRHSSAISTHQLERAATRAFRDSFLVGAGLALLALLTVIAPRRRTTS